MWRIKVYPDRQVHSNYTLLSTMLYKCPLQDDQITGIIDYRTMLIQWNEYIRANKN